MMLNFSANVSLLFTETTLINRFKSAKNEGFNAVEIQFPYELDAYFLKNMLEQQQLKLVLFNVAADDLLSGGEGLACVPEKRDQFREAVIQAREYAKVVKPQFINVLSGCCFNKKRKEEYLNTFKENLHFAVEAFSPLGIKTVFEAINSIDMPGVLVSSGEQMLCILNELDQADLYMQYDIYHMQMMGEKVMEFIAQYVDKIGHIQFADCPGRGQPGTGKIDFEFIFSGIEKTNYSGHIGAEYKPVGATPESMGWLQFREFEGRSS
jgi:hydroxypyruvate isomerase